MKFESLRSSHGARTRHSALRRGAHSLDQLIFDTPSNCRRYQRAEVVYDTERESLSTDPDHHLPLASDHDYRTHLTREHQRRGGLWAELDVLGAVALATMLEELDTFTYVPPERGVTGGLEHRFRIRSKTVSAYMTIRALSADVEVRQQEICRNAEDVREALAQLGSSC